MGDLLLFEKVTIYYQACYDIKHQCLYVSPNCKNDKIIVSPFVEDTLRSLLDDLDSIYYGSKMMRSKNKNDKRISYEQALNSDNLIEIDEYFRILEGKMESLTKEYISHILSLESKYVGFKRNNLQNYAMGCVKAAGKRRKIYILEKKKIYDKMVELLSRKIKLLEYIKLRFFKHKSHQLQKIRYYYKIVSEKWNRPLFSSYSEKEFSKICGKDLDEETLIGLKDVKEFFEEVKSGIAYPIPAVFERLKVFDNEDFSKYTEQLGIFFVKPDSTDYKSNNSSYNGETESRVDESEFNSHGFHNCENASVLGDYEENNSENAENNTTAADSPSDNEQVKDEIFDSIASDTSAGNEQAKDETSDSIESDTSAGNEQAKDETSDSTASDTSAGNEQTMDEKNDSTVSVDLADNEPTKIIVQDDTVAKAEFDNNKTDDITDIEQPHSDNQESSATNESDIVGSNSWAKLTDWDQFFSDN